MSLDRWVVLGILLAPGVAGAAETHAPAHRLLAAVPFTEVKLSDAFWAPRIRTNREKSLPHNFKWCEETGRISNFAKAAGLMPGKFEGIFFNDSDVYKVLEGASYALADQRDPELEKKADEVIAKIAAAQQPDGYINTYFTLAEPDKKWTDFAVKHELYCGGHLIEGAVAHYQATGKKTFLNVAIKLADHLDATFGPGKRHEVCGHEEIELALVKLYQATGEVRYLKLAEFFLDLRGDKSKRARLFGPYAQDHIPVRQQREIVGHAVRAMYLYTAVADMASYTGDAGFIETMRSIWNDVVHRKMYITAGIGARHEGEAFGEAYELPNDTAYCETCAAIGLAFWAHRLNQLHADAQYADVLERAIYNGILSGIALDGEHFFYVNPLASAGKHHRQPFFGCACCPSNVVRFVPSIPGYVYAQNDAGIAVNLYATGTATVARGPRKVKLAQETQYPWDGKVTIRVEPEQAAEFDLAVRIPAWCEGATIAVNGQPVQKLEMHKGYARLHRAWQRGDVVELNLPMPVQRIEAHPLVKADAGRVAIQRGPIVYCFEQVDNGGPVKDLVLAREPKFTVEHKPDLLGGVTVVRAQDRDGRTVTAIPYYAWDHRQPGEMIVWVRQDGKPESPPVDATWEGKLYRPYAPSGSHARRGNALPATRSVETRARIRLVSAPSESAWKVGTPIVTYWAGPPLTDAVARQMAEGGFNLVWCSEQQLDVAQRHGLRAMLTDGLLSPAALDQPAQREKLDALIARVRNHPALYCYFITDEPSAGAFPALGKLFAYLRERDPAHMAYVNLFPTYANNQQLGTQGDTVTAYREHLRQYLEIVKPSLVSWDHYQFAVAGDNDQYFLNLALIRQACQQANVPFLQIVQACTWTPSMRVPTADEMRYLVYSTLAYGAQGISYYVYCHPGHTGGIALPDGTPTPIYHALKTLNREFVAIAKELQPLRSLGVYHCGMTPPGAEPPPKDLPFRLDPPIPPMPQKKLERVKGILLGLFGPAEKPTHVLVVNMDYGAPAAATLVGPGNLEVFDAGRGTWSPGSGNRVELSLSKGGGSLVRVGGQKTL